MKIKEGAIGNISIDGRTARLGCIAEYVDDRLIYIYFADGGFNYFRLQDIQIKAAKGIPEGARKTLAEAGKKYQELLALQEKQQEIYSEIRKIQDSLNRDFPEKIASERGLLGEIAFVDEFIRRVPEEIRAVIDAKFNVAISCDNLVISRWDYLDKWADVPFIYQEYDGQWMLCDNAEADPTYQKYLEKGRVLLPCKMKIDDRIMVGDKRSIDYYGAYVLPIKEYSVKGVKEVIKTLLS